MDFFDKRNVDNQDRRAYEDSADPLVPPAAPPAEHHEGLLDRISHRLGSNQDSSAQPASALPPPQTAPEVHEGILHKLGDAVRGVHGDAPAPVPAAQPPQEAERKKQEEAERAAHHNIFGKIGDPFHRDERVPPSPEQSHSVFGKIGVHMLHEELPRPEEQGLRAKVNAALSGGAQAEADEDHLDKAVEFAQQHIFRQGTQSHELFWQQMKDEQIANMVRKQYKEKTGHEFPSSYKTA